MSVNSISAPTSTANNSIGSALSSVTGGQSLGEQTFLQLLVTQLTNQDPSQPQDDQQFLAQLAQFSTVEGVNNLQTASASQEAVSLIGKTVTANLTTNNVQSSVSGQVTGVSYDSTGAASLTLQGVSTPVPMTDLTGVQ